MQRPAEIPSYVLRRIAGPALKQIPPARAAVRGFMNAFYRVALIPFGRNRPSGRPVESQALVARTDELNRAAEDYFVKSDAREFILGKPFSDEFGFARHLFNLGVLLHGLRLRRSDVVLEFGAGGCWVSHFLNRYGCRTIAIDVSPTALELGQELFRRDPATNWSLNPEFLTYDGHRLPLPDASCTRVIVFDAFHHVPNQREILTELHRVLTPDGILAMSEPGVGHAETEASRKEVEQYGVLENELVIEDLAALAEDCGFRAAHLIVASPDALWEIPARDLGPFIRGKGFTLFWEHHSDALLANHYLLLYKGDPRPSTRQPKAIGAYIRPAVRRGALKMRASAPATLRWTLTNTAETIWVAAEGPGWTRLGAHLYRLSDNERELINFDWLRVPLPCDVAQFERVTVDVELPGIDTPGRYEAVFDMVVEGQFWFGDKGSKTTAITIDVE